MVADVPRQVSLRRFPGSNVLSYYVIIIFIYNYTYNRVTSICIDLSKIKLFVFVFALFGGNFNKSALGSDYNICHVMYVTIDFHRMIGILVVKVNMKCHEEFQDRNAVQTLVELCTIRAGVADCDKLSYNNICYLSDLVIVHLL